MGEGQVTKMQGVTCRWFDEEKNVIYEEFGTRWEWSDLEQLMDTVAEMLEETSGQVDFIADLHQTALMPSSMLIQNFKRFCQFPVQNPRYGSSMVVGIRGFVKDFWQMFSNLYDKDARKLRVELVKDVEEAYTRILERRSIMHKAC